jgi:hypothetical protein
MPFEIRYFPKGHKGKEFPHYMLYKFESKQMGKRHFKSKESAINSAKQAIKFREKKESKIVKRNNKTYVVPIDYKFKKITSSY